MKNKAFTRQFLPILIVFIVTSLLIIFGRQELREWNTDAWALESGNDILFGLTLVSYFLLVKSIRSPNAHAFVRMVYGSLIIKMVVCMIAAFLYGWLMKPVNKNAIFGCFILYVVYTFMEVRILLKFLKKSPDNA
jgi:hypothetical protein